MSLSIKDLYLNASIVFWKKKINDPPSRYSIHTHTYINESERSKVYTYIFINIFEINRYANVILFPRYFYLLQEFEIILNAIFTP